MTSRKPSYWSDRPVLVTGGAGFIGSHLVDTLLNMGANVRVIDLYTRDGDIGHLVSAREQWDDKLDIRLGTISNEDFVRHAADGIDTIFHLAALIGIPYSYVAPGHYVETNVQGTLAVLEAVRASGTRRLIHTSTSECFGTAQYTPMDEKHPLVAQSPYAATKIAADKLAESYYRSFELPVVTLRPFNTFGPRQSTRAVIPTIIYQLLQSNTVKVGSTTPIRDMNPVWNTVDAFLQAGEADNVDGELFVVGSGIGRSVRDIIGEVGNQLGLEPNVVTEDERVRPQQSEVEQLVCNYNYASKLLGYKPKMTFETCLELTIDHCRKHPKDANSYSV